VGSQPLHSSEAVAGLDKPLSLLLESVLLPYTHPALLESIGLQPARGILLHGPPGTGKTQLVRAAAAIAARSLPGLVVKVFAVDGSSIMSSVPGETEARLRTIFAAAGAHAAGRRPGGSGSTRLDADGLDEDEEASAVPISAADEAGGPDELITVHDFSPTAIAIAQLETELRSLLSRAAGDPSTPATAASRLPASGAAAASKAPAPRRPALDAAPSGGLSIVFLDEMDALCPRRFTQGARIGAAGSSNPVTARLVAQLLTLMDGVQHKVEAVAASGGRGAAGGRVVVVGATNRPDAIDPALRRPGRFDREVRIDIPNADARLQILRLQLRGAPLHPAAAALLPQLAAECVGFVGADLQALCRDATRLAADRAVARRERLLLQLRDEHGARGSQTALAPVAGVESVADAAVPADTLAQHTPLAAHADANLSGQPRAVNTGLAAADGAGSVDCITPEDFIAARLGIVPSALRGISTRVEHTQWSDVGGMDRVIDRLRSAVEAPLRHPQLYARMRIAPPRGVLLHGPPGNSKTTLVRALASAVHSAFFAVSGAEVYSPYLGEAERTLRALFARARETAPAIIFLDEVDALVGSRGIGGSGGGSGEWCVVLCPPVRLA
jgi:SpoVK/Ycf46/Vps4 family AAA+-type ATPase